MGATGENVDSINLVGTVEQGRVKDTIRQQMGPVIGKFTVQHIPEGDAPSEIRSELVNVSFPVREHTLEEHSGPRVYRDSDTGNYRYEADRASVPVIGRDAVDALREANHGLAANWWQDHVSPVTPLLFWASEGHLELFGTQHR